MSPEFPLAAGLATLLFAIPHSLAFGQTVLGKNFKVAEFYEAPHQSQMKFVLEGAKAQQRGKGEVLFTEPKWQTFRISGEREFLMEAPECLYDSIKRTINSAGRLRVSTADGKFALEGEGFLWRQTNSSLIISNRVHTVLRPDLFSSQNTNRGPTLTAADRQLEIFADHFEYETGSGLGVYRGHLRVEGTNLVLRAGTLSFLLPLKERQLQSITASEQVELEYEDLHATGERALYAADKDAIRLTGQPTWGSPTLEGRGDDLLFDRTNRVLQAVGHAYLKILGQSLQSALVLSPDTTATNRPASTNQFLEVTCDHYDLRTNAAAFREAVRVADRVDGETVGTMNCGTLDLSLTGTNQLERLVAHDQVVLAQGDQRFEAGQAIYQATNQVLELTDHPRWSAGTRSGAGDRIVFAQGQEMIVQGNSTMRLPATELARATTGSLRVSTNNAAPSEQFAFLSAQEYRVRRDGAWFAGKVRLEHPQMKWESEDISVRFATNGGPVEHMVAESNVLFELTDESGQSVKGSAQKAVYSYSVLRNRTNDLVELTGDPVLVTTNGIFRSTVIYLDRARNKLLAPGNYSISAPVVPGATNKFVIPKLNFTK
jgi:lipopolysaccharide export system protein LptA